MFTCDCCPRPAESTIGQGPDGRRRCALCEAYRRYVTGEYSEYVQALAEMELAVIFAESENTPPSSSATALSWPSYR